MASRNRLPCGPAALYFAAAHPPPPRTGTGSASGAKRRAREPQASEVDQNGQFVDSVPPSTSKTLPVTQLEAGEAR